MLFRFKKFNMSRSLADGCDNDDIALDPGSGFSHVVGLAYADFEYQPLGIFMGSEYKPQAFQNISKPHSQIIPAVRTPQHGKREPNLRVVTFFAFSDMRHFGNNSVDRVLSGNLADRAGNGDNLRMIFPQHQPGLYPHNIKKYFSESSAHCLCIFIYPAELRNNSVKIL